MVTQTNLMISLALIGIFSIALISFAINFAIDNEAQVSLSDDSDISNLNTNLQSDIDSMRDDTNTSVTAIMTSTIGIQSGETEGGTAFKVGPGTALNMAYRTMKVGFGKIFGADSSFSIIFTTFTIILAFVSVFVIWKAWKGNP